MNNDVNIIKTRDDYQPVLFEPTEESKFKLCPEAKCSWHKGDEPFDTDKLRPRIEPWLTALVQSEHLSLLIGSGLTHAVHHLERMFPCPKSRKPFLIRICVFLELYCAH